MQRVEARVDKTNKRQSESYVRISVRYNLQLLAELIKADTVCQGSFHTSHKITFLSAQSGSWLSLHSQVNYGVIKVSLIVDTSVLITAEITKQCGTWVLVFVTLKKWLNDGFFSACFHKVNLVLS